ncbi:MAG: 50S ribosomal protein L15 [Candidatus Moraniibacteriota bacterium]|nr:MAG: 50S ribosomal protein L15 [Candidatus Moranbacteria bacterium]
MKLHTLSKIIKSRNKRLGQGYGSGRGGHTSSRGQKGQKSRGSVRLSFTGSSWVWFKRLPFIRGKSRFETISNHYTISLNDLNKFADGSIINTDLLRAHKLIGKSEGTNTRIRIVSSGTLTKKLTVHIPASRAAVKAIEKAGGEYSVQTA